MGKNTHFHPFSYQITSFSSQKTLFYKVDLALDTQASKELADLLHLDFAANKASCPSIAFFPRKSPLSTATAEVFDSAFKGKEFREFVWQRLKMSVTITNRTPWKLNQVGVICPYVIVIELHKRRLFIYIPWTKYGLLTLFTYTRTGLLSI
jgi:hypothetical protein